MSHKTSPRDLTFLLQHVFAGEETVPKDPNSLTAAQKQKLAPFLTRLKNGEPLQRILGEWEFWGLPFHLSKDTLVPRPDTETLVEAALKKYKNNPPEKILDLGTGSGCILIALLHEWPESYGVGIDLSADAIKTAQKNAVRNNVFRRASFVQGDWTQGVEGKFNLIVSNPPYIDTDHITSLMMEVKDFDPILALDGGADGLQAIRAILNQIPDCLEKAGTAFLEIGFNQRDKVLNLIDNTTLCVTAVHADLGGHDRVIEVMHGDKI
jgi:release factor glutamine methyltransferase